MLTVDEFGLFEADLNKEINIFTGAGFSTLSKNANNQILPAGDDLRKNLITEFKIDAYASLDLPSIYAILRADRRQALRDFLDETFTVTSYDPAYNALTSLNVSFLYSTNVDDLPFHIFAPSSSGTNRVLHDNYAYGAPRRPHDVVQYIPLHGCVRHADDDFIFTAGQISSAFASDRETWYVFQRELQARATIFLGYGMRDAGVLQALHDGANKSSFNRWILLRKHDEAAIALYQSLGFHVLVGDTLDFLNFIGARAPTSLSGKTTRKNLFGSVPQPAEIAQRPIKYFFVGAEPEWSDAYSNQVVHRRINSAVKNSIFTDRHVAIVGLPLSGKSMVLKQVAAEIAGDRDAQYFDRIAEHEADLIIAEHKDNTARPLIFVDNLIDSRNAIDKIVKQVNAQIVCAEQSLYFDSVSLPTISKKLDVVSASEISKQELQSIIDSIPIDIRRWKPDALDVIESETGEYGLFETFRRHVFEEALSSRFKNKLVEFEARDREAFDVYIMACFAAACRVLVSFDMIYMFMDRSKKEYTDVYKIIERIDSFLMDVNLPEDPHQDYFSVRSGALARIALKLCSNTAFGRVYKRLHAAVPDRVIVDYQTYRRYAYDNDYARRAFPRLEDGREFYERLVHASDNAFDYQHGAIYLSKLKSFTEAFSWIDNALSRSKGKIFSIRNTHARILFEANIEIVKRDPNNQTALDGLRESMEVLQDCIERDQRRSYHLLRFSDQALQYADVKPSKEAAEWLTLARDRLSEMEKQARVSKSRESYNLRKYQNLSTEVRASLASLAAH